jgi:hypothetical protein
LPAVAADLVARQVKLITGDRKGRDTMNCLKSKSHNFSEALRIIALGGLLVLLPDIPVLAQTGLPLWQRKQAPASLKTPEDVVRGTAVQVNAGRLRSTNNARFSLLMPDGRTLNVTKSGETRMPKGLVWHGKIVDEPASSVSFSVVNDTVVGSILTGRGQSFRLRRDASGVQVIEEVDLKKLPPEGEPTAVPGRRGDTPGDSAGDTCATDGADRIDVMVVYTHDALIGATSKDAMESDIYLAVDQSNQSYINSKINQRLRLVHIAEVSYVESGNSITDRDALKAKADGLVDNVHTLRNTFGADAVVMITETSDKCGRSFIMDPVGNAFEDSAFAVVARNCATLAGKYSFPHELGHVMSARHDWTVDNTNNAPYSYNHGHNQVTPSSGTPWRTIMAYEDACTNAGVSCPRVLNWSNPGVSIGGDPTGIATGVQQEDNHRTLNNTALTVANFRCSVHLEKQCKGHFHTGVGKDVYGGLTKTEARELARKKWRGQVAAHDGSAWNEWSSATDKTESCAQKGFTPQPPPVSKPIKYWECQAKARPCLQP